MSVEYEATIAGMEELKRRVRAASVAAAERCVEEIVKPAIQDNLSRLAYPPASPPGEPPAQRSGYLHDEIYTSAVEGGSGAIGEAWPSTVYARIQELSGWAGRNHASFLPARPYVAPALEASVERIGAETTAAWRKALEG